MYIYIYMRNIKIPHMTDIRYHFVVSKRLIWIALLHLCCPGSLELSLMRQTSYEVTPHVLWIWIRCESNKANVCKWCVNVISERHTLSLVRARSMEGWLFFSRANDVNDIPTFPIEMGSMFDHVFPKSYAFGIRRLLTVQVATTSESLHTMWPSLIKCKYSTEMKQACDNLLADTRNAKNLQIDLAEFNHFQHSQWYLNQETQLWQRFQKSLFGIPKENMKSRCLAALAVGQGLWGKCETEQCHLALGFAFIQHKWKLGHDSYEWTTSSTNDRKNRKDKNDEREKIQ